MVKWLTVLVGEYLWWGSPLQDYTQEQDLFVKSFSWDRTVSQQFNNFRMHKKERNLRGGQKRIMELSKGGLAYVTHPFHYSECWLNLPSATNYDPLMPWVMLLQQDGELANRKVTFVDDIHGIRHGKQVEDQCVKEPPQVLAFRMNHKGNQCAGRNFGLPTLSPHP
ncbi:hypothetical protein ACHAW6_006593 [Cyclotella cf. meneghiniana]